MIPLASDPGATLTMSHVVCLDRNRFVSKLATDQGHTPEYQDNNINSPYFRDLLKRKTRNGHIQNFNIIHVELVSFFILVEGYRGEWIVSTSHHFSIVHSTDILRSPPLYLTFLRPCVMSCSFVFDMNRPTILKGL